MNDYDTTLTVLSFIAVMGLALGAVVVVDEPTAAPGEFTVTPAPVPDDPATATYVDPGDDREAGEYGEELGGDPAGAGLPYGHYGEELGGDPAGR